jgi:trehalose 6-phosphate phosphatase
LKRLGTLAGSALFLDVDGTLVDIAATPQDVIVPDGLVRLLGLLTRRLEGALAIVTGRPIVEIDNIFSPLAPVAAGIHGAELRLAVQGATECLVEPIDGAVVEAVRRLGAEEPGTIVEVKKASIAIHYRTAPLAEPRIEAALHRILENGPDHLILCRGRKVLEIVPRRVSKGAALHALMELPAFRGRRPIMIGDDVSDQSAFEAAGRLGGRGLKVAGGLFASADADFASPADVRAWLAAASSSSSAP